MVVVESHFAEGDNSGVLREVLDLLKPIGLRHFHDVAGVHANGGKNLGMGLRDGHGLARGFHIASHGDHLRDAGIHGAGHDIAQVFFKPRGMQVAVGIDQHGARPNGVRPGSQQENQVRRDRLLC